jgi:tetratricopeptide (TPR) repeat protein
MSAAPGRPQASSHGSPQGEGTPVRAAPPAGLRMPEGWIGEAHALWEQGQRNEAIQRMLDAINDPVARQSPSAVHHEQLGYYVFLLNDLRGAIALMERVCQIDPSRTPSMRNLGVLYGRVFDHEKAVKTIAQVVERTPDDAVAWDVLAAHLHPLGRGEEARSAGTRALMLKDERALANAPARPDWHLPAVRPSAGQHRIADKPNVIAFSLWGAQPRYLRGALRNVLVAPGLFPGWTLRFYVDQTVPAAFVELLRSLGTEVVVHPGTQADLRERLCWRFLVANDPQVGYFLARDADAVLSHREALAVQAWLDGGAHFHVIRDWWSHTDLMLAGMWGGVAGVLPSMRIMLRRYQCADLETPNIDQWFLRDRVWPLVRASVCVHDRLFSMPGSQPVPGPVPAPPSSEHIGQNEFAVRADEQAHLLRHWTRQHAWL